MASWGISSDPLESLAWISSITSLKIKSNITFVSLQFCCADLKMSFRQGTYLKYDISTDFLLSGTCFGSGIWIRFWSVFDGLLDTTSFGIQLWYCSFQSTIVLAAVNLILFKLQSWLRKRPRSRSVFRFYAGPVWV